MKQYKDALTKIAELVGYKFNNEVTKVEFERVALEGGEVFISNQSEGELTLGDTIYIETEEGFEPAPAGTHRLDDGREIVLDEESSLVEFGGVLTATEGTGGSASQFTVRVIPTVGKNFLQLTFPVILGSFFGSVFVSTGFSLAGWSDGNAKVEMDEF